ncbi:imidazole glycerol phosphate synthase subunit HisF [Magnetospira sp. QH-2]|uniref:imidazole glycerol phosphate synthase subunit HisF n=1 Tax=Magnetospira sp. (strain QH-2) TaxID=1288970 RepID=UPI0003E80F11|nr:imidazole glycerol phosphate synthase cyclase subunit [Magnetospira sp. QH-2]CCQ75507.1 Imidazole glycerol phosphate synthase subunit HisF [Magnetospira sp. QH-2]
MRNLRLIARLDIKGSNLIKGVRLEGLRKIGDPQTFARRYYGQGVDEIIYMDTVASLYGRNNLSEIVAHTASDVFIPITVGGGIRSVEDAHHLLRMGADKLAINTAATQRPELLTEIAEHFGSQCVVLSIEAQRQKEGWWEAYADNGRERTGLNVVDWVQRGQALGAGEILLTSVDQEGTAQGFDVELIKAVTNVVDIPVIASGGLGGVDHLDQVVSEARPDAVAMAHVLHYDKLTIGQIRDHALDSGLPVRRLP